MYTDGSYIFCNYETIVPKRLRHFNTLSPTLSKALCTSVEKFPCPDFGAHSESFVSIRCHLENGVHAVHSLQVNT
jgi:hypothetical protein